MTIKKFTGKTEEDATQKARQELGESCVIMNIRTVKPTGILKIFKSVFYEITAAIEEKDVVFSSSKSQNSIEYQHQKGRIDFVADEKLEIQSGGEKQQENYRPNANGYVQREPKKKMINQHEAEMKSQSVLEERLEHLQNFLENKLSQQEDKTETFIEQPFLNENISYIKMVYKTLLENEVNERYANQLLDETEKATRSATSLDYLLSNIYQKMVLKFGQAKPITKGKHNPKIIFFVGPTGVGKTTTIAKLASKLKMEQHQKIALLTADTYRIAAAEQLRIYANILDTPLSVIYTTQELKSAILKVIDYDFVLVDTAGFSHKNQEQRMDMKQLVESVDGEYDKTVYLVVSATTKYRDLVQIADSYKDIANYQLLFTKLDETDTYGNIYNLKQYTGAELSYVTVGQNVPDDISVFNTQKIVRNLLGGN